ncbi:low molecular weight protein arginine phosphatase [Bacillus sp. V3B]|uniref:low molecular weight protein arginine phosphatase n=1 Tax=Bacillus sp. V3B TaxID=2804915 RepID=UPI00210DC61A|nr:low molecular weight protein arginine phosphatase [Bacillus sp. V3B]MCQ6274606.1 low molecular weight protein arginine phosphatase [Bacillus sp. V3B]
MTRVLFVCTGNTCRSPMAEALLKSMELPGIEVCSAGIYAENGSAASTNAKKVLDKQAIPHDHQSSMLTDKLVEGADYILTMTLGHKSAVMNRFPNAHLKTFTLKEFAQLNGNQDIADPFGGSEDMYRAAFSEIKEAIEKIVERLKENT